MRFKKWLVPDGRPSLHRSRKLVTGVSLFCVCLIALAVSGEATGTASSRSAIVIRVHGTNAQNAPANSGVRGVYTVVLAGKSIGAGGTTVAYPVPGSTKYVNGQAQVPFSGTMHLASRKGTMELTLSGTHIDVNLKAKPSGDVVGSGAEFGSWRITQATGIYHGWKGGGNFAAVSYGYQNEQPYAVEFDGYVTAP